jgi:hypothetical protein
MGRRSGFLLALCGELLALRKWPAIVALVFGPPLYIVLVNYGNGYKAYRTNPMAETQSQLTPSSPDNLWRDSSTPLILPRQFSARPASC